MSAPIVTAAARPGPFSPERRALSLGLLLGILLIGFESLAVATALPQVARDLHGLALYGWPLSAFFMGFMVGTVGLGALADRDGPGRPAVIALLLFGAGLLLGGLAPNMGVLIGGRVLQGLGGGALVAVAYQVVNTAYPEQLRARMLALFSSGWVLPALVGPALASWVTQTWSWRGVFLGLLPLVAVVAALALPQLRKLPAAGTPLSKGRVAAVVAAALSSALALWGLSEVGQGSAKALWGLAALLGGAAILFPVLGRLFPRESWRLGNPLSAGYAERFFLACAFFGTEAVVPLGLAELRGLSLLQAGLALTSGSLTWAAMSFLHSRLDERTQGRYRPVVARCGAALLTAGLAGLWWGLLHPVWLGLPLLSWALAALGMGLAFPSHTLVVMAHAHAGQQGQVSGTLQLSDMLGSALGAGLGGALLAALGTAGGLQKHLLFTTALAVLAALVAGRLQDRKRAAAA